MHRQPRRNHIQHRVVDQHFRFCLCSNALDEIRREADIHGNSFDTTGNARPEDRDPLQSIFRPDQYTIALVYIAFVEMADDRANLSVQIVIRGNPRAKSITGTDGFAHAESLDFGDKFHESFHGALIPTHYPLYIGAVYSLEAFYEQIF